MRGDGSGMVTQDAAGPSAEPRGRSRARVLAIFAIPCIPVVLTPARNSDPRSDHEYAEQGAADFG